MRKVRKVRPRCCGVVLEGCHDIYSLVFLCCLVFASFASLPLRKPRSLARFARSLTRRAFRASRRIRRLSCRHLRSTVSLRIRCPDPYRPFAPTAVCDSGSICVTYGLRVSAYILGGFDHFPFLTELAILPLPPYQCNLS